MKSFYQHLISSRSTPINRVSAVAKLAVNICSSPANLFEPFWGNDGLNPQSASNPAQRNFEQIKID